MIRDVVTISIGVAAGAAAAVIAIAITNALPDAPRRAWTEMLGWIAHPAAAAIAALTRQPLQAELSIAIHLIAIVVTFMVVGGLIAWLLF
ncbi:MAG: hypothetical protein QOJ86_2195 [Bradyrhizobium sp.]|jgi:hypothetical protein|nr:hypothetical protein [Bradyrhizobium sp.]